MRYKKTIRISTRSYSSNPRCPLGVQELILRQVNREDNSEPSFTSEIPVWTTPTPHKASLNWLILFKTCVMQFKP